MIAAHGKNAVGDHQDTLCPPLSVLDGPLESRHVEVRVDCLVERARQAHRVDDAAVIELIADHNSLVGNERRDDPHDRGVSGGEDHPGLATMELSELPLQLDVRRVGPADETHRPWAHTEGDGGLLLGGDHVRPHRHTQVGVGVHPDELLISMPGQLEAWPTLPLGCHSLRHYGFSSLRRSVFLELGNVCLQCGSQSIARHMARSLVESDS